MIPTSSTSCMTWSGFMSIRRSVDEKSQIQALDSTQPGLPLKKGPSATMTHDYKRKSSHGALRSDSEPFHFTKLRGREFASTKP